MRPSGAPELFGRLLEWLLGLPAAGVYAVVGTLAATENVFPPVPADTAVALGAFLSHSGTVSAVAIFAITWVANVGSAAAVYGGAYTVGRRFLGGPIGRRFVRPKALGRIETLYARHGLWGIFLSRFIPGVRAVVPPFAGVAHLSPAKALPPMAVASAIWYGMLTYIAARIAGRLEELIRLLDEVNRVALGAALGLAGIIVLLWHVRRMRQRRYAQAGTDNG